MSFIKRIAAAAITAAIMVSSIFAAPAEASNVVARMYASKYNLLIHSLKGDAETMKAIKDFGRSVVFFSVSDGKQKAKVFLDQSYDLSKALTTAYGKAKSSGITPKWLKLDVVISDEEKSYDEFIEETIARRNSSLRQGIAFTSYYGTALLEAQLNSSGIIDYEEGTIDLKKVNAELTRMGKKKLSSIPSTFRLFKTQGFFAENTAYAMKLTSGSYANTGKRELDADRAAVELLASRSSSYLKSICGTDGKFVYGYYPIDNEEMEGYNILRHAGTVWNLIMQYDICRDESLVPVIKSGLKYLKKFIQYKDKKTAFVIDGNTLNIGGNGLALLAYTMYEEVFASGEYNSVIRALANGVVFMQNKDGSFTHALRSDNYKVAQKYIIIYYDGEAAYGLLRAYGILGDSKYLDAACKAADYFIKKDYVTEHSHWMGYVFNEITKYKPLEEYFTFGLKNVDTDNYSSNMMNLKAGANSVSETLNTAFEMYDRLITSGVECAYLEEFDAKLLVRAVMKRASYGLNYFMFPEYAMYFTAPETVLNSFAVREDSFRIRIDDIQHFMDGYYLYWKNYDIILDYKDKLIDHPPKETTKTETAKTDTAKSDNAETAAKNDDPAETDGENTDDSKSSDDIEDAIEKEQ